MPHLPPGPLGLLPAGPFDSGTLGLFHSTAPGPYQASSLFESPQFSSPTGFSSSTLRISQVGIEWLKRMEQVHLTPYDDQTGKPVSEWVAGATIGVGHLISAGDWSKFETGITEDQAEALLLRDLWPAERAVRRGIQARLQQYQYDALVSLAFNIGESGFKGSSVRKLLNNPAAPTAFESLEAAWKAWNKSQGKTMQGLKNRRDAEWNTFTSASYSHW